MVDSPQQNPDTDQEAEPIDPTGSTAPAPTDDTSNDTTNVMTPQGELVSVANSDLPSALSPANGMRLASPDDLQKYQDEQTYGTPGQMAQTAIEGGVRTATFGTVPGFGNAQDILGRQRTNPWSDVAGSVAPFIMEDGLPEAVNAPKAITAAGKFTSDLFGLTEAGKVAEGAGTMTSIGAKALQVAGEGAIINGSNEVSKSLLTDPEHIIGNVTAAMGTGSLYGGIFGAAIGGIGVVPKLWAEKFGAKVTDPILGAGIKDLPAEEVKSGITVPPTLRDAMSGEPDAYAAAANRMQSDSIGGRRQIADVDKMLQQAQGSTFETLGAGPEVMRNAPDMYATADDVISKIKSSAKKDQSFFKPAYDEVKADFPKMTVDVNTGAGLIGDLTKAISDRGLGKLNGSPVNGAIQNILNSVSTAKNLSDVTSVASDFNSMARKDLMGNYNSLAGAVNPVFDKFENDIVTKYYTEKAAGSTNIGLQSAREALQSAMQSGDVSRSMELMAHLDDAIKSFPDAAAVDAEKAKNVLAKRAALSDAYKTAMTKYGDAADSLKLHGFRGIGGFLNSIEDKQSRQLEPLVKAITSKNNKNFVDMVQKEFPEAAGVVRDYHISNELYNSKLSNGSLNTRDFLNNLFDGKQTPLHIQNLMSDGPAGIERLNSIRNMLNAIPTVKSNPTADTLVSLAKGKIGAIAGSILGIGGGHIFGGLIGGASEAIIREIKPFLSYKIAEMRGSGKNILPQSIKAMFDYSAAAAKGELIINKAIDDLMNQKEVLSPSQMPSEADRTRLDGYVDKARDNPELLNNAASDLKETMPDHQFGLVATASGTAKYLNSIKPQTAAGLPLDSKIPPSPMQVAGYNRQLNIAQQPLMILDHIRKGTLTPQDVTTLQACHGGLCKQLQTKIGAALAKEKINLAYKQRQSLSLFLGQPLDTTMTPAGIIGAQPLPPQQQPQGGVPGTKPKRSINALNKLSSGYTTPTQAAEQRRGPSKD